MPLTKRVPAETTRLREILVTLSNQVSTLSFGAATVGLLAAAAATLWKDAELLSGLLLLLIVPIVCFLTLAIYSGEQVRLMRAGLFMNRLENCVNDARRSDGGALLTWEQWQEIRTGSGDVDGMNRMAITLVFVLLAVGFIAMGFWRLHTTKVIPEWLAVVLTALAALLAVASTAWVAWLKRYAYEHRRRYKYTAGDPAPQGRFGRLVLGGSLVVLGLVLLLDRLAPDLDELLWPVAVVALGVAVMLVGLGDERGGRTWELGRPAGAPVTTEPLPPTKPVAPADRHGSAAATVLVGTLLVLVGIGWLLDAAGVEVPWRAVLPAALIAVGLVACVAGAFRGRQHALMAVGMALTVVLSVAVAADWDLNVPLGGGVGDRTKRPAVPAELTGYELGVGNLVVDLRQLQVPPGTTTVEARVGIGELAVELPQGVSVAVMASSGLGPVQALGQHDGGFASRIAASSEASGDRRLDLDLRVGLGQVRVEQ